MAAVTEEWLPFTLSLCSVVHFKRPASTADERVMSYIQKMVSHAVNNGWSGNMHGSMHVL